jgi:hypothetical protein
MNKEKNYYKEPFDAPSFLNQDRLKEQENKIESGEITCNMDSPEDCESCSG